MISKKNIKIHELIGLKAKVKKAKGMIIDESKNTLTMLDSKKEKIIPKKNNEIMIKINNEYVSISGNEILQKPQDRIKKKNKVTNKWQEKRE
ncbi:MAG: ribonuclease P protein subunit [Candidatus Nanoarchaeia archaeon]|nr:ribonuclease P protein subunit [Candidatus Nanoarchaeia archaeon]MDD5053990.1 ribonuclease P protein subunit [Candidatus Nanoarchaeia archaeon]MDD5499784.1 ribonuclease P protein subunit [Candidatus Nanoarchaeia archaeon]